MAKQREKGCLHCRSTGWITDAYKQGTYCRMCQRGAARFARHQITGAIAVLVVIAVLIAVAQGVI
jgi:hypothetical protein